MPAHCERMHRTQVTHLERPRVTVLHHDNQIGGACKGQEVQQVG